MKQLVIGILAHVDSGKTTLSEAMLYSAGVLKKLGRVDHGDAFLDTDDQEKRRGITIFSKQAVLSLPEAEFTLLDTPGHVDFSPEMERTLQVLDYAILVISGTDGMQSHTETLWRLLKKHRIPTFLFINKMDLALQSRESIMTQLQSRLGDGCVDFSDGIETPEALDQLSMCSENLMEEYLATGKVQADTVCAGIRARAVFPCCFGSALKLQGIQEFLQVLEGFTKAPDVPAQFGARVFKIARDDHGNRLSYLKVTGGTLPVKTMLQYTGKDGTALAEKANELRIYSGAKYTLVQEAVPGMVCAVTGLTETYPGLGLGFEAQAQMPLLQPVLNYRVESDCDAHVLLGQLKQLEEEEPQLHVSWNETLQEIRVQLMGRVQLEILQEQLRSRFQTEAELVQGSILYQETIGNTVEGVGHFEPLRHYAEVHLLLEPGPSGSGVTFDTDCSENDLDRNWQRLILTHLAEKSHVGVLIGAPLTDVKITLVGGKAHLKHSEGGDFRQATYRAVRQGLMQAQSILLEPWYSYRLELPSESVGRAITDLQRMGCSFTQGDTLGDTTLLTGRGPVSGLQDYALEVSGYTHGRGRFSCVPDGYEPCQNQEEIIAAAAYDPEADLENTPDSVFCSHGSGTIVKWYDVPEHMHLPAYLTPEPPEDEEAQDWQRRAREYCAHVATDKELMAIFERTYGPIQRDSRTALRTPRSTSSQPKRKPSLAPTGPEYLLVDGYNIIFAWDDLSALAKDSLEAARSQLIHMLCNYQGIRQCELILVFDAYRVKGNPGSVEQVGGISVVYTKEAETADMYIERVTHQMDSGKRVRVATSDGLVQMIILGHGALRISARSFRLEVDEAIQTLRSYLEQQT
jgi:small GTP-binding protein